MHPLSLGFALTITAFASSAYAQSREERIEPSPKQIVKLQELTPVDVATAVRVKDDDLDTVATLDTSKAYQSNGSFTDRVKSDNFLRALVNKSDRSVVYELYQNVRYGGEARRFTSVNFLTGGNPVRVAVLPISLKTTGCYGTLCFYDEDVGFIISETTMREIASSYQAGASQPWRFRFNSQTGLQWEDRMMPAEVAGLMMAVDSYLAKRPRR